MTIESVIGILLLLFSFILILFYRNKARRNETNLRIKKNTPKTPIHFKEINFLNEINDPIILLDKYKIINYINKEGIKKFGNQALGKHIASIIRVPDLLQSIDLCLANKTNEIVDIEINIPLFQFFKASIIYNVSKDLQDDGSVVLFLKDVTEIIKAQRFRSDFIANASHELKTPLVSIKGFLETLSGPAKDDKKAQEEFIPIILQQANRMENLINDLLSLSRIELEEHLQPQDKVNLKEIFQSVEDIHQNKLKEFEFKNNLTEDIYVKGDYEGLLKVFSNLIDNSIKYSENNKIIEINHREIKGKLLGIAYEIIVSDRGIGIHKDKINRVTERFFRVDPFKSSQRGGTGLGLSIVKHEINKHRGVFEIESDLGMGTKSIVYLLKYD
ncbi:MAG: ATP-binding protein [Proteobacteria bacterium]|nr:ATP-binding protein [Pseudomonadota bacterium]